MPSAALRQSGFSLLEVLVASLLLALFALVAGRALHGALAAVHDATLHGRALDLATDLSEELAASTSADERAAAAQRWPAQVRQLLPQGAGTTPALSSGNATTEGVLRVRWTRAGQQPRQLHLPLHLPALQASP